MNEHGFGVMRGLGRMGMKAAMGFWGSASGGVVFRNFSGINGICWRGVNFVG